MFIIMFRCDQYRWVTKGVYTVRSGGYEFKTWSNAVDNISLKKMKVTVFFGDGSIGSRKLFYSPLYRRPFNIYCISTQECYYKQETIHTIGSICQGKGY